MAQCRPEAYSLSKLTQPPAEAPVLLPWQFSNLLHHGHEDITHEGKWFDPVKVHLDSKSGYFDASTNLQRSLEQLLRLRSEQSDPKFEGKATLATADVIAAASLLSVTKMEK